MIDFSSNVKIEGRYGTWHKIDKAKASDGKEYILFESDQYGDETACILCILPKESDIKRMVGKRTGTEYIMIPKDFEVEETFDNIVDALEQDYGLDVLDESINEDIENLPEPLIEDSFFDGNYGPNNSYVLMSVGEAFGLLFYGPSKDDMDIEWEHETRGDDAYEYGVTDYKSYTYHYKVAVGYSTNLEVEDLEYDILDDQDEKLTNEEAIELLHCTPEEFEGLIHKAGEKALAKFKELMQEYVEDMDTEDDDYDPRYDD